jgi:hemerythrin-like domain-containing protein
MERHEALVPFSRDHYIGLVQAQHLKKAAEGDAAARRKAVAAFVDAWDTEIAQHFADEERLLLNLAGDADRRRLLKEHQQLTDLAAQARTLRRQSDPNPVVVQRIGDALDQHIRWEERELFVRLQDQLSQEQLAALGHQTELIEKARPRNACRRGGNFEGDGSR